MAKYVVLLEEMHSLSTIYKETENLIYTNINKTVSLKRNFIHKDKKRE